MRSLTYSPVRCSALSSTPSCTAHTPTVPCCRSRPRGGSSAEGAKVLVADILDEEGKALADELGALYQHLDVSSEDDWAAAVDRAVTEFGGLTVLVNNAGILHFSELGNTTLADYERVIRVNQIGAFLDMRSVVEPMSNARNGLIVNLSSVERLAGMPFLVAYTASKFAIRGMTKVAALNGVRRDPGQFRAPGHDRHEDGLRRRGRRGLRHVLAGEESGARPDRAAIGNREPGGVSGQ